MANDARLGNFGSRIDDAAKRTLRSDRIPNPAARIDTLESMVLVRPFELIEVPPRDAVDTGHQRRIVIEQRWK